MLQVPAFKLFAASMSAHSPTACCACCVRAVPSTPQKPEETKVTHSAGAGIGADVSVLLAEMARQVAHC